MVGEPTTFTKAWFDAFPEAAGRRAAARARACTQDRAGDRADAAGQRDRRRRHGARGRRTDAGMKESEAAALWEGFVHGEGTGWKGQVELALGFSLVWSGPGIRTFTATGHRPVQKNEPTLFEIWVCADGYWCDHTKNVCPGKLDPRYEELLDLLLDVYGRALDHCRPGASLAELDVSSAPGSPRPATPASRRIRSPRRRCACTRAAVRASGRHGHDRGGNGAGDRAGCVLGGRRRPADRGQLPHHRRRSREAVEATPTTSDDLLDRRSSTIRIASTRRSASTTRRCATASRPSASCSARRTSSSSRAVSTSSASSGSRPAFRASRRTTGTPSS